MSGSSFPEAALLTGTVTQNTMVPRCPIGERGEPGPTTLTSPEGATGALAERLTSVIPVVVVRVVGRIELDVIEALGVFG
jgi:hypothetical protein